MSITFDPSTLRPRSYGERNRSTSIVPKSGTLKGCIQTGTLQIEPFRSTKWSDLKSDTKDGTVRFYRFQRNSVSVGVYLGK